MIGRFREVAIWLSLGLMLAVGPAFAVSSPQEMLANPQQEARAEAIGHQLRCLVCQNESVEESDADLARDLRHIIRTRVETGDTNAQVIAWMVARYGEFIRLRPPFDAETLVLWLAPIFALCIGALAILLTRRHRPVPAAPLTGDERRRLATLSEP